MQIIIDVFVCARPCCDVRIQAQDTSRGVVVELGLRIYSAKDLILSCVWKAKGSRVCATCSQVRLLSNPVTACTVFLLLLWTPVHVNLDKQAGKWKAKESRVCTTCSQVRLLSNPETAYTIFLSFVDARAYELG